MKNSAKREHVRVLLSGFGERNALPGRIGHGGTLWALGDCPERTLGGFSFQEGKCVERVSGHFGFRVSDGSMVGDVGQGQPNQAVVDVSARVVEVVGIVHGIDSFRGVSLPEYFLLQFPLSPQGRKKTAGRLRT